MYLRVRPTLDFLFQGNESYGVVPSLPESRLYHGEVIIPRQGESNIHPNRKTTFKPYCTNNTHTVLNTT